MSRRAAAIAAVVCLAWTAAGALLLWPEGGDRDTSSASSGSTVADSEPSPSVEPEPSTDASEAGEAEIRTPSAPAAPATPGPYAVERVHGPHEVAPRLKRPPGAGLLFDVDSGEVLWARNPGRPRPIASLTKMLTALIVAERHRPDERVLISAKAPRVEGSRIGVLKPGGRVPLRGLFAGLLMASGNDAAAALAEHDAGTIAGFVARMNRRAVELGLACSRFAGPAGLQDRGNRSCAYDLAALARADLDNRWVASITGRRSARFRFPVKGGMLSLANNHYFVQRGIAGIPGARVTGVKTGYTNGAGRCYVTSARLRGIHLGVVLLDSVDPLRQVPALLRAGFAARGAIGAKPAPVG